MIPPSAPIDEPSRLETLSYRILDTPREALFDSLTHFAAGIVEAPIALISLVDANRQWFKSRHGLNVAETSRSVSFCAHVVASSTPLVVPDALEDLRFADDPLVVDAPKVRLYAVGYPRTASLSMLRNGLARSR